MPRDSLSSCTGVPCAGQHVTSTSHALKRGCKLLSKQRSTEHELVTCVAYLTLCLSIAEPVHIKPILGRSNTASEWQRSLHHFPMASIRASMQTTASGCRMHLHNQSPTQCPISNLVATANSPSSQHRAAVIKGATTTPIAASTNNVRAGLGQGEHAEHSQYEKSWARNVQFASTSVCYLTLLGKSHSCRSAGWAQNATAASSGTTTITPCG